MTNILLSNNRLYKAAQVYLKPRVLLIIFLGFSSGLPLALSASTLTIWMIEFGVDLTTIGFFALVGLPYSLKFCWAPAVDSFHIPVLTKWLGRRRGWLLASQITLIVTIIFLGALNPLTSPWLIAFAALLVAAASATQDILIDAYRVESLENNEQAAGSAYYVSAYRIAMLLTGAGIIFFVDFLESKGVAKDLVWFYGYLAAALFVVVGIAATLLGKEPANSQSIETIRHDKPFQRFVHVTHGAFSNFLTLPAALSVLIFIIFFKFCDALAGFMTGPFVLDIGFDKTVYAGIVKGVGVIATLAGGFLAGFIAYTNTIYLNLWLAAIVQMLSNFMFIWLAWLGSETWALTLTIVIENFAGGFGTVIFVAYISMLCHNPAHTATQFALLTALSSIGRTVLSASSGMLAETFGWIGFFFLTSLTAIPALILLIYMNKRGHFKYLEQQKHKTHAPYQDF